MTGDLHSRRPLRDERHYRRGLYLTGGGALLRGLDKRLSQKIKLPVHVADDPLKSVVRGTGLALKNYDRYPFVMR